MSLNVLESHSPIAFLSAMFRICGASRGPSASADILVINLRGDTTIAKMQYTIQQLTPFLP